MIPNHKQFIEAIERKYTKYMKHILLLISLVVLLPATGCLVAETGRHGHGRYEHHSEVIVGPPVIVVRPPEIIVR